MGSPDELSLDRANAILDHFSGSLNVDVCYIIDTEGKTIASSNQYLGEYYFVVLFRNGMGTPDDQYDDVYVYSDAYVDGRTAPDIGAGWEHYDFDLPFDFTGAPQEVPAGWTGGSPYNITQLPADVTFQDVIQNVTQIEFWWNHPDWAAIFSTPSIRSLVRGLFSTSIRPR